MTTRLIIARHGNTFEDGETPRRVGRHTDLPLTGKGREQARRIGQWLRQNGHEPEAAFCSPLRRTQETVTLALAEAGCALTPHVDDIFNEIDYGPDENRTEDEVIARVGAQAIKDWDEKNIVPAGWRADPQRIAGDWRQFATNLPSGTTTLVVTSNGIARFAARLTDDFEDFRKKHALKISTGAVCVLESDGSSWIVKDWNLKP